MWLLFSLFWCFPLGFFSYLFLAPRFQSFRKWKGGVWFAQKNSNFWIQEDLEMTKVADEAGIREYLTNWKHEDYRPKAPSLKVVV